MEVQLNNFVSTLDLKYATEKRCSHKGCTFDHAKLKKNESCENNQIAADDKGYSTEILCNEPEVLSLSEKDGENKRSDSGLEKSLNESLATTSGFLEIENSQKDSSKYDKLDISFNSSNNGDDEEDDVPSLALDSDDDAEWDKCSSTKDPLSGIKRSSESINVGDINDFEMVKPPNEDEAKCVSLNDDVDPSMNNISPELGKNQEKGIHSSHFSCY